MPGYGSWHVLCRGGRNVILRVLWDPCFGCHGSVHKAFHGRCVRSLPHTVGHKFRRWDSSLGCDSCSKPRFWWGNIFLVFLIWSALMCQCLQNVCNVLSGRNFWICPFCARWVLVPGILECTSKSRSCGFLLAPQVRSDWYRSLVMSDVPRVVQFRLRNWWIWVLFMVFKDKEELIRRKVQVAGVGSMKDL